MKKLWWLGGMLALLVGCSDDDSTNGTQTEAGNNNTQDGGGDDGGGTAPKTWTYVYEQYFQAGSVGDCGSSSCHGKAGGEGGFRCNTKDNCYTQLTTAKIPGLGNRELINLANPSQSILISPTESPVAWFNPNGTMPDGNAVPNATAKSEITSWVNAGAENN